MPGSIYMLASYVSAGHTAQESDGICFHLIKYLMAMLLSESQGVSLLLAAVVARAITEKMDCEIFTCLSMFRTHELIPLLGVTCTEFEVQAASLSKHWMPYT